MPERLLKNRDGSLLTQGNDSDIHWRFLLPHVDLVYRAAYRLAENAGDAEDLAQETFYYALKNFAQLNDRAKCKYWLFAILRNLFLRTVDKEKKRDNLTADFYGDYSQNLFGLETGILKSEVENHVRMIVDRLDQKLRMPIILFFFQEKSYKEIADTLNIPIGTVMSRIARAKVFLKKEYMRCNPFFGHNLTL